MNNLTIGALARAAGVGVETVRYYQRRALLPESHSRKGAFRTYGQAELDRLHFIRRAQTLGFSLDEISELLDLDEMTDRENARVFAKAKIADIESRVRQLEEIRTALESLVRCCEHSDAETPCPILHALATPQPQSQPAHAAAKPASRKTGR